MSDRGRREGTTHDSNKDYGITRLSVLVNLSNPGGSGEDTVTGDGRDETGGSDDGDGHVLRRG